MSQEEFAETEKEVLILLATLESIDSFVNYEVLDLNHNGLDSEIRFKSATHQKFFNIMFLDFLTLKIFGPNEPCIEAVQTVVKSPCFNRANSISDLSLAVEQLLAWLEQDVRLIHRGDTRMFWFPSIDREIALSIKRKEFIKICGTISKHNRLGLTRQAEIIKKIFERNKVILELTEALLVMEDFYQHFHDDIFNYHSSTIAEFLNNVRLGVHDYLQPEYHHSYVYEGGEFLKYRFTYPANVKSAYGKTCYWDLMNKIRAKPYMPKFLVTEWLKKRF